VSGRRLFFARDTSVCTSSRSFRFKWCIYWCDVAEPKSRESYISIHFVLLSLVTRTMWCHSDHQPTFLVGMMVVVALFCSSMARAASLATPPVWIVSVRRDLRAVYIVSRALYNHFGLILDRATGSHEGSRSSYSSMRQAPPTSTKKWTVEDCGV